MDIRFSNRLLNYLNSKGIKYLAIYCVKLKLC